jgi:superfamily II DNA or RNA helicase
MNTYLGGKGYTILKSALTLEQQVKIRNDLMIKPFVMGSPMNDAKTFPVYRESAKKMYVPHYYGIKEFGIPKQYKISEGDNIELTFNGQLRDYQAPVVNKFIQHCLDAKYGGGLLELYCAWGKTSASLNIITQLKKKTLVIVHKEFLMNQWIERITQFLPEARVGKIQGQVIDIDNKDIVIAMLQSLSMKEYPESVFESFGFTIIDEVHHISSEVFSRALFKLVTKYMLGLSATMNRKDGTTPVFKMFLGDVIFKSKRDNDRAVVVRAIDYYVDDDDFNEVKFDYRGNPQYSSMISKLCEYNRRSEFILKILVDMLKENPNQQIMILAHNKNLLKYLHDAIDHRNIESVGYYVGGMKESALKETETKKVVIATYSMASEALDIKTLTTLIMATPKTDIEQSVGRILREKHSNPIVVDIIDSHDLFKNQWRKRKVFYKKENYKIIHNKNTSYTTDLSKWKVVYEPKQSNSSKPSKPSNPNQEVEKKKKRNKTNSSTTSNSSTDKSIVNESDSEIDNESDSEIDNETDSKKIQDNICYLKLFDKGK